MTAVLAVVANLPSRQRFQCPVGRSVDLTLEAMPILVTHRPCCLTQNSRRILIGVAPSFAGSSSPAAPIALELTVVQFATSLEAAAGLAASELAGCARQCLAVLEIADCARQCTHLKLLSYPEVRTSDLGHWRLVGWR